MIDIDIYLGLVHYPVYNKNMQAVTTSVTNFDIHDIARSCKTYDVKKYYIIHPLDTQKEIIDKIVDYWQEGYGNIYNPDRSEAMKIVNVVKDIASTVANIIIDTGKKPIVVATDARIYPNTVSYMKLSSLVKEEKRPLLLLFGTGWGIEKSVMESFDYILQPILGKGEYNHLSVRSAVAIILDRLAGEKWWQNN